MSAYQAHGKSHDWYTPAYVFDALGLWFDLDVSAPVSGAGSVPSWHIFTDCGLQREWFGLVWMNPPFGHQSTKRLWLRKFFGHGNGVALMPDRTSAPWFQEFAPKADVILWVNGKIKFDRPDGSRGEQPGDGTVLLGVGRQASEALRGASTLGMVTAKAQPVARRAA